MSGARFTMDFSKINSVLGKAVSAINERQEMADTIGGQLVNATTERFDKGITPEGKSWKESARAEAEDGQTLADTGRLKNSIVYEASPVAVAVGTGVEYAAIHQFGGTIKPKRAKALKFMTPTGWVTAKKVTMPARPYIGINQEDIDEAAETIRLFMERGLGIK